MITTNSDQFGYIYRVIVNADDYPPEAGYPFTSKDQTSSILSEFFQEGLPIVFDIATNLFMNFLASMHHSHARPTLYTNIIMENRIRTDVIVERYYKYDVIKKRCGKIYTPSHIDQYEHTETPNQKRANAWLVSFDTPEDLETNNGQPNKDRSFLCFSEKEAVQLNRNLYAVMAATNKNVFFPLPKETDILLIYPPDNRDPIYDAKLAQLNQIKDEFKSNFEKPKSLLQRIAEKLLRRSVADTNTLNTKSLFPHIYFRKYTIIEASNPRKDNDSYRQAISFLSLDGELNQRYSHNQKFAKEISVSLSNIEKDKTFIVSKANAYLQTHLKDYITHKLDLLDKLSREKNSLLLPSLKAKESILNELKKIDYIEIYKILPKHEHFFTVEFKHFNDIIDKKLSNGKIDNYLEKKLNDFRP